MRQETSSTAPSIHHAPMRTRMLQGAGIAFLLIALFLYAAGEGNPEWPRFWRVRPLVIVPIAGSLGGIFYYYMDHVRFIGGWSRVAADFISLIAFVIVLWLGTVLGLDGTMWN